MMRHGTHEAFELSSYVTCMFCYLYIVLVRLYIYMKILELGYGALGSKDGVLFLTHIFIFKVQTDDPNLSTCSTY